VDGVAVRAAAALDHEMGSLHDVVLALDGVEADFLSEAGLVFF
jgi:hypothetical protein